MYPVLAKIGPFTISTFGLFLSLSLVLAVFIVWRLAKVYDLDGEKILDIFFLTFVAALVGSRVMHVLFNLSSFNDIEKMVYFNKFPGLSFWGGLIAGSFALYLLARRNKINLYVLADIASVGLIGSLILGKIGCFLGSCQYGVTSNFFLSVNQFGLVGQRFPIQVVEAILFTIAFFYLWKACLKFHFTGKIASLGLIFLGLIEFFSFFIRADEQHLFGSFNIGHLFSLIAVTVGGVVFYKQSKRSFTQDLRYLLRIFSDSNTRQKTLLKIGKSWYNLQIGLRVSFAKWRKRLPKRLNVKANPTEF